MVNGKLQTQIRRNLRDVFSIALDGSPIRRVGSLVIEEKRQFPDITYQVLRPHKFDYYDDSVFTGEVKNVVDPSKGSATIVWDVPNYRTQTHYDNLVAFFRKLRHEGHVDCDYSGMFTYGFGTYVSGDDVGPIPLETIMDRDYQTIQQEFGDPSHSFRKYFTIRPDENTSPSFVSPFMTIREDGAVLGVYTNRDVSRLLATYISETGKTSASVADLQRACEIVLASFRN